MHAETCAYRNLRGNTQNITHLSSLCCDWQHILYTGFFVCIRTFAKFHFEYWYAYGNLCILKPKAQRSLTYLVYVATASHILYTGFSVCIQTFTKFYFEYWYAYMLYAYKNLCVNTQTITPYLVYVTTHTIHRIFYTHNISVLFFLSRELV